MSASQPGGPDQAPESTALAAVPPQKYTLRQRLVLTYRVHGPRALVLRAVGFPLRFTPLRGIVQPDRTQLGALRKAARRWYRVEGRPVTIVIPSYRDAALVTRLVSSLRRTTEPRMVRIIVADDASGPEHLAALREIEQVEVLAGERNLGFAGNANRGIRAAGGSGDVVLLNSDVVARPGWLEALQYATEQVPDAGLVGAKLLYPDGRIQFGGTIRNPQAPEWFDHRFRFRASDWAPANIAQPVLGLTGACLYLTRAVLDEVGLFDEDYPMAYEDVDLCLRAWRAGYGSLYWPAAELEHDESLTRGRQVGERERISQERFWTRWGEFFEGRKVRDPGGSLHVIYVTEDTGVGGGHRVIFEHLNGLHDRGHRAELWTLSPPPDWFELRAPTRRFDDFDALSRALAPREAIKIATWWKTAAPVWMASLLHGIGVYFVQDIETSYYPGNPSLRNAVLASYRAEFHYLTTSAWNADRLREFGLGATVISPGVDLRTFRPLAEVPRRPDLVLALGRSSHLKNLPLTLSAWRALPHPRPELCLFGVEPEVVKDRELRYVTNPSDEEVNRLLNQAAVFVQTSVHEGFCLPPLEAMATGAAVVCTDAHGNRDYCRPGENCLMPAAQTGPVSAAISELLEDPDLRRRLGQAGLATAARYDPARKLDELERFLLGLASGQLRDPRLPAERSG